MTYSPPTTPAPNPPPPDLLQYGWISLKSSSHLQVKLCLKEACRNMGHEGTKSLISPGSCYFVSLALEALGDAIRLCENLVGGRRPIPGSSKHNFIGHLVSKLPQPVPANVVPKGMEQQTT